MSRARAKEATSPQQEMTHNMMTRSKTRAAAARKHADKMNNFTDCDFNSHKMITRSKQKHIEINDYFTCPDCDLILCGEAANEFVTMIGHKDDDCETLCDCECCSGCCDPECEYDDCDCYTYDVCFQCEINMIMAPV